MRVKKKKRFVYCAIVIFACVCALYGETNGLRYNATIMAYGRMSDLIEQTGNEDTFGAYVSGGVSYSVPVYGATATGTIEAALLQGLSAKGRFFEEMHPPSISLRALTIAVDFNNFGALTVGMRAPYLWSYDAPSYFPPYMFAMTGTNMRTIATGERDVPLLYGTGAPIGMHDTGLFYDVTLFSRFVLGIAVVNGGEGLDANSSKHASARIAYVSDAFELAVAGQIGDGYGSVPTKEPRNIASLTARLGARHRVIVSAFAMEHGINDVNMAITNEQVHAEYLTAFGYSRGFLSAYSVPNFFEPGKRMLGAGGFLYFLFDKVFFKMVSLDGFFSVYDANVESGLYSAYQPKYRAMARITVAITDALTVLLSDTYTYDPVYFDVTQFYEAEPRALHYQFDNDLYLGVALSF